VFPNGNFGKQLYYMEWNSKGDQPMVWKIFSRKDYIKNNNSFPDEVKKLLEKHMWEEIKTFVELHWED
jgi:hypothetical protein